MKDASLEDRWRCSGRYAPTGLRNRALIALLYRTGLRINEALSLYPKDLDLEGGSVRVLNGKGGKSRTVGLDPGAAAVIERWLEARSRWLASFPSRCHDATQAGTRSKRMAGQVTRPGCHDVTPREANSPSAEREHSTVPGVALGRCPVFCTLRGQPMSDAYVRVMLKRPAARAGIDKRVHAHGLRHTHATQLRAEGVDIAIISRQLGHASITTTARYLDHLAPRAVIEAMRRRSWTGA
ncbi:MAG: tyrosine-type recombinase/integrase [Planctomycetota bacterium]